MAKTTKPYVVVIRYKSGDYAIFGSNASNEGNAKIKARRICPHENSIEEVNAIEFKEGLLRLL